MEKLAHHRLILDSGAIIALSRNDTRPRAVLTSAWEAAVNVSIPAVVLAETVRGRRDDTPVNRIVKAVGDVIPATESDGRLAGALLGAAGSSSTIDAIIVAIGIRLGGAIILTGDPDDLSQLSTAHREIRIQAF